MITKDIQAYADNNWAAYKESISLISKSGSNHGSLVNSEKKIFNFDKISIALNHPKRLPTSIDGLRITSETLELVEFKRGFKQIITTSNYDPKKIYCEHLGAECTDYRELFFKNQDTEREQLIHSLRLKAIESFVTMEKLILPLCENLETQQSLNLKLTVVIDEDGIDSMEHTLTSLSGESNPVDNCYDRIKRSLSRLANNLDACGKTYYYDLVEVFSVNEYQNLLKRES